VLDFLSFAVHRKIDTNAIWVAEQSRRIVWAILPIVSPGRTMLLFTSGRLPQQTPPHAVRLLADALCRYYGAGAKPVALAQLLLDPADRAIGDLYRRTGFDELAELIYLQKSVKSGGAFEPLDDAWELANYSPESHALFADTIVRSYEGSLDCPALNGRRDVEDVIAGHQATGLFDPSMWFVLRERATGAALGVLLLNPTAASESVELVYLGLVPASRGKGVGDALMRLAVAETARREFTELSLAVDARNAPALRLYHRHGMRRVGSRVALVRDLRAPRASVAAERDEVR
jgi:ribosomal protein S18 acetylase RimI-like enzyme